MKFLDKYGFPVKFIKNKPITNFMRLILHTNIKRTWLKRETKWLTGTKGRLTVNGIEIPLTMVNFSIEKNGTIKVLNKNK